MFQSVTETRSEEKTLDVEIVVPVYDELQGLASSIARLHEYLSESFQNLISERVHGTNNTRRHAAHVSCG